MDYKKAIIGLLVAVLPVNGFASEITSFRQAKDKMRIVYMRNQETFYCGCKFYDQDGRADPSLDSCDYKPRTDSKRAFRVEWDHVVPASYFGKMMPCWEKGGRKECRKNPLFKMMEADMHNIVPAIGEINSNKSNYLYDIIDGEKRDYGACDFEVDRENKVVEPKEDVRGDIARKWFYMSEKYSMPMPEDLYITMKLWHFSDPVSLKESILNNNIALFQGNSNPYVDKKNMVIESVYNKKAFVK